MFLVLLAEAAMRGVLGFFWLECHTSVTDGKTGLLLLYYFDDHGYVKPGPDMFFGRVSGLFYC